MRLLALRRPTVAASALVLLVVGLGGSAAPGRLRLAALTSKPRTQQGSVASSAVDGGGPLALPLPPPAALAARPSGARLVIRTASATIAASSADDLAAFDQIPGRVFVAYERAAQSLALTEPGCHLPWQLLAGIGKIESDHARGGVVTSGGETIGRILGPVLDGSSPGIAAIRDTDHGVWDGNKVWDRAVGPMQFIPASWRVMGRDADGKDAPDPNNVDDSALAAGAYLCNYSRDLSKPSLLRQAVFGYNQSTSYVNAVLAWMTLYARGVVVVADAATAAQVRVAVAVARTLVAPPPTAKPTPPFVSPTSVPSTPPLLPTSPPPAITAPTPSSSSSPSPTSPTSSGPSQCPSPTDSPTAPATDSAPASPSVTPSNSPSSDPCLSPSPSDSGASTSPSTTPTPSPAPS
jgi:hypothetical protein